MGKSHGITKIKTTVFYQKKTQNPNGTIV